MVCRNVPFEAGVSIGVSEAGSNENSILSDCAICDYSDRLLACNLRPEFEYVGAAPRKFALVLAFVVAGASGIAVFITDSGPDPDPMTAMALAPVEALS